MNKIKQNITKLLLIMLMILSVFLFFILRTISLAADKADLPSTPGSELSNGGHYIIPEDVNDLNIIATEPGQSGLVVPRGSAVTIEIPEGKTLKVKGADAVGKTGAGAGIFVPESASLTIIGSGTLTATGGKATDGCNGENGGNGYTNDSNDIGQGGKGGQGGDGGGGAGAAIGGTGGNGGAGGAGGSSPTSKDGSPKDVIGGEDGKNGSNGSPGTSSGNIRIASSITISNLDTLESSESSNCKEGVPGKQGFYSYHDSTSGTDANYGGGGGAGAGGYPGRSVSKYFGGGGGGGGGAPGGGSGACGSNMYRNNSSMTYNDSSGLSSGQGQGYILTINGKQVQTNDRRYLKFKETVVYAGKAGENWGKSGSDGSNGTFEWIHVHKWEYKIKEDNPSMIYAHCIEDKGLKEEEPCPFSGTDSPLCYVKIEAENKVFDNEFYNSVLINKSEYWQENGFSDPTTIEYYVVNIDGTETKTTAENSGAESEGGKPKERGTYIVKVTVNNLVAQKTFRITKNLQKLTIPSVSDNLVYNGSPQSLISTPPKVTEGNSSGSVFYSLNEIDWYKTIPSATDAGEYWVYYRVPGNSNYEEYFSSILAKIEPKKLDDKMVSNISDQIYSGTGITPEVIVKDGENILTSSDYTIMYENNIDAGEAIVKINGKGNYSGLIIKKFNIVKKILDDNMISNIPDQIYSGTGITPEVIVKDGENILTSNDYTVMYENNINAGEATVKIHGKGIYGGEITKTFKILPRLLNDNMISDIPDQIYSGSKIEPKVNIKYEDITLVQGTDYTLKYENNINVGNATVKITGIGLYSGELEKNFLIKNTLFLKDLSATKIIKGQKLSDSKITGKAVDAEGIEQEGDFSFVNNTLEPSATLDKQHPSKYDVIFKSKNNNYEVNGTVEVFVDDWGKCKKSNGKTYWEDTVGMTSAIVSEGIAWLKEEVNGNSWWFGLENPSKDDNGTHVFEIGSKFWVMCLKKDSADWNIYYNKLDDKYKKDVEEGRVNLFVIGVTSPNGINYTDFGADVPVYIQLDEGWETDVKCVFVDNSNDQVINDVSVISSKEILECPVRDEGIAFTKVILKHFSTYAVYDQNDNIENNKNDNTKNHVDSLNFSSNDNNTISDVSDNENANNTDNNFSEDNSDLSNSKELLNDINTGNTLPMKSFITLACALANKLHKKR